VIHFCLRINRLTISNVTASLRHNSRAGLRGAAATDPGGRITGVIVMLSAAASFPRDQRVQRPSPQPSNAMRRPAHWRRAARAGAIGIG
jgi:hypothetical protein